MTDEGNEAVKTLLGNPRRALIKLSIPIMLSMMAHAIFQLIDIIWVSGLGPDSISAVGFFGLLVFLALAITSGITVGGGTCISQRIGAKDKEGADKIVSHMFALIIFASLLFIVPLLIFSKPLFLYMGAQKSKKLFLTFLRSVLFVVSSTLLLGILFDYGLLGVWTGISKGNWIAAIVAVVLSFKLLKRMDNTITAGRVTVLNRNIL